MLGTCLAKSPRLFHPSRKPTFYSTILGFPHLEGGEVGQRGAVLRVHTPLLLLVHRLVGAHPLRKSRRTSLRKNARHEGEGWTATASRRSPVLPRAPPQNLEHGRNDREHSWATQCDLMFVLLSLIFPIPRRFLRFLSLGFPRICTEVFCADEHDPPALHGVNPGILRLAGVKSSRRQRPRMRLGARRYGQGRLIPVMAPNPRIFHGDLSWGSSISPRYPINIVQ